jgi:hypothetical protein
LRQCSSSRSSSHCHHSHFLSRPLAALEHPLLLEAPPSLSPSTESTAGLAQLTLPSQPFARPLYTLHTHTPHQGPRGAVKKHL